MDVTRKLLDQSKGEEGMSLEKFDFKGNDVRTVIGEVGEPWFILKDVCDTLGLTNTAAVKKRLDLRDLNSARVTTSDGIPRNMHTVNESGLYDVIFQSNRPEAKEFKRWVTHEVLPSIRKRGGYLTPEATEAALTDPDFIIRLATELKEERAKRAEVEAQNVAMQPKALFADAVSSSHSEILVGELAKILRGNGIDIGQQRMFAWLRENGFLIARKGTDWNMPTQKAVDLELFRIKETAISHSDGHVSVSKTPKVTGKGQQYFISRFLEGKFNV